MAEQSGVAGNGAPPAGTGAPPPGADTAAPASALAGGGQPAEAKPSALASPPAELQIKLPDGIDGKDATVSGGIETVKGMAKAHGLSEAQANGILADWLRSTDGTRKAAAADAAERNGWAEALKNDRELGGDKYASTLRSANSVFAKFPAGKDALAAIEKYGGGLGNNPAVVRLFAQIGAALKEDTIGGGGLDVPTQATDAEPWKGLYTNS